MDRVFGPFFRWFNGWFGRRSEGYSRGVTRIVRRKWIAMAVYAVLLGLTALLFACIPAGFVPAPDKQYLIGIAQLPAGATLDRTLFEVVSAFSTTGLSTGLTAELPLVGQALLVVLMLVGRLGPITLATALALRRRGRLYQLPEERPIIG